METSGKQPKVSYPLSYEKNKTPEPEPLLLYLVCLNLAGISRMAYNNL